MDASAYRLVAEKLTKRYFGAVALVDVSLSIRPGEIHGLLGENGAGKSTLLKIISGVHRPDSGQVFWEGRPVEIWSPRTAGALGIAMIHQELNLVQDLSVAENVFIRREPTTRFGLIDWSALWRITRELLLNSGIDLDPRARVRDLSIAEQQMVEIARALSANARLLIMDEPTSSLPERESNRLLDLMRTLSGSGISILFVTHRMAEALAVCDRFTVLRDGRLAGEATKAEISAERLISMMAGREANVLYKRSNKTHAIGAVRLAVEDIRTRPCRGRRGAQVRGVSLSVRAGEILGLAGLIGAGRSELASAIFGADRRVSGRILLDGEPVDIRTPRDAMRLGIVLAPEDRKRQSLFPNLGVRANFAMAALDRFSRFAWMQKRAETLELGRFRTALRIRMGAVDQPVRRLSGGNQQKVILARWLVLAPKVLIVDEPTRGVDVGAKSEVHALLDQLAAQGVAVIVISSELPELMSIADRIVTLREGVVTGETAGPQATSERLMALMTLGA
ncbi:MAG: sugar ABC transporter ATP-binding protein [Roseiarcus sp.]|jgi:inositol transport system ATP-binding protein